MGDKKKKISGLPLAQSLVGLYTIGVNAANDSVRVSLEWLKTAYDNVMSAISNANRATESANTAAGKANKAATDAGAQMTQISQEASAAIKAATDAAGNAQEAADNVQDGKTTQFEIGTVESGAAPSASLTDNGVDATGNPKKKLNLVMQKGDNAKSPTVQTGTITAGDPASEVTFTFAEVGMTEDGRPIWRVDGAIPRGQQGPPGAGSGNVSVDGTGLVIGKKYLFVPSSDDSTAGTFVEYVAPEIPEQVQPDWNATEGKGAILHKPGDATADASGLMSADQFQKLEKLSPSYLSNDVTGKKVEYTDAGKLLFEGKETFAVDASNELTLAGKKLSDLGGGDSYYELPEALFSLSESSTQEEIIAAIGGEEGFNSILSAISNKEILRILSSSFEGMPATNIVYVDEYAKLNLEGIPGFFLVATALNKVLGILMTEGQFGIVTMEIFNTTRIYIDDTFTSTYEPTVSLDKLKLLYNKLEQGYFVMKQHYPMSNYILSGDSDDFTIKETYVNFNRQEDHIPYYMTMTISRRSADNLGNVTYLPDMVLGFKGSTDYISFILDKSGDGTKALMDDGTYKEVGGDYQLPSATDSALGGIKIGYVASEKNYPVQLDGSDKAYVNVPWTDTNTTYDLATTSANGLMSSTDKTKLDRIGSYTTATTVANLNANYENIEISNLSANASLSVNLVGTTYNGWDINVFIYCSSARTITIPTSGNYISMIGSSLSCPAGKWTELNLHCAGGKWRIAKLEQE